MSALRTIAAALNEPGVATRWMTIVSVAKAWLLVDLLYATQATDRAVQLGEPLLIFIAAALGVYITGRTVQARAPAQAPTQANPNQGA